MTDKEHLQNVIDLISDCISKEEAIESIRNYCIDNSSSYNKIIFKVSYPEELIFDKIIVITAGTNRVEKEISSYDLDDYLNDSIFIDKKLKSIF